MTGDTATLRAEVTNISDGQGIYNATLLVDRMEAKTKSVALAPGATETVTFSLVKDKAGYYEIAVGNRSITLAVREAPPPAFHISELAITPAAVNPDASVTITATVENTGGTEGDYIAELKINNIAEQKVEVTIPAGMKKILTFPIAKNIPGIYTVTFGDVTKQFVVAEPIQITQPDTPKRSSHSGKTPSCCSL